MRPPSWHRDALCAQPAHKGVNFFPERGESAAPAKAICGRCVVRSECLSYALEVGPTGIWAGTSGHDRRHHGRIISSGVETAERRQRVAQLLGDGLKVGEVARLVGISEATVRRYRRAA